MSEKEENEKEKEEEEKVAEEKPASKGGPPRPVVVAVGAVAVVAGLYFAWDWWRYARTHATTENAYVHADVTPVSARIGGTIIEVPVDGNDAVRKGDVLVRLDTTDLEVAVRTP